MAGTARPSQELKLTAQALYLQGLTVKDIASRTGLALSSLKWWASKLGWAKARQDATVKAVLPVDVSIPLNLSTQGSEDSLILKDVLAKQLIRQAQSLGSKRVKQAKTALELSSITKQLVDAGAKLHAWDSGSTVNIRLVSQMRESIDRTKLVDVEQLK